MFTIGLQRAEPKQSEDGRRSRVPFCIYFHTITEEFNVTSYLTGFRFCLLLTLVLVRSLVDLIFAVHSECFIKCYKKWSSFLIQKLLEVHSSAHCFKSNQVFKKILECNRNHFLMPLRKITDFPERGLRPCTSAVNYFFMLFLTFLPLGNSLNSDLSDRHLLHGFE